MPKWHSTVADLSFYIANPVKRNVMFTIFLNEVRKTSFVTALHTPPSLVNIALCFFPDSFSVLLIFTFDNRSSSLHFPHLLVLSIVGLLCSTVLHFGLRPMVEVRGNVRCGLGIAIKSKL